MATRKEQKEQRRQQILVVALEEFIAKGYHGTSTNDIAKKCGVSSGLMFHYFDSKKELYLALLEQASSGIGLMTQSTMQGQSPLEILTDMARFSIDSFRQYPESVKMFVFVKQAMFTELPFVDADKAFAGMNMIEGMAQLIVQGQQLGQIRQGDPVAMTTLFFTSLQGVAEMLARYPHLPLPQPEWFTEFMVERGE